MQENFIIQKVNGHTIKHASHFIEMINSGSLHLVLEGVYDDLSAYFDDTAGNFEYEITIGSL